MVPGTVKSKIQPSSADVFLLFFSYQRSVCTGCSDWALVAVLCGYGGDWQRNVVFYSERLWVSSFRRSTFSSLCTFPSAKKTPIWNSSVLFKQIKNQQHTFLVIIYCPFNFYGLMCFTLHTKLWGKKKKGTLCLFIIFGHSLVYISRMHRSQGCLLYSSDVWLCFWNYQ